MCGKIKLARIGIDISQKDFAKQLDVSPITLNKVENLNRIPSSTLLKRICELLGLDENEVARDYGMEFYEMRKCTRE